MVDTIDVRLTSVLEITETLDPATAPAASDATLVHDGYSRRETKSNANPTPDPVSAVCYKAANASGSTIDLTAAPALRGTLDMTGLKLQYLYLEADAGNADPINFDPGAANPYAFNGAEGYKLQKGGTMLLTFNDLTPDVAGGAKTIDIVGTGGDNLKWIAVFG